MCSMDRNQRENSEETLLSNFTTTNVSEFQEIEDKSKSLPPNYVPTDVSYEQADETMNGCDKAALKSIDKLGILWKPAKDRGQVKKERIILPIVFKLG